MGWLLLLAILLLITLPNLVVGLYLGCVLGYGPPNLRTSMVLIAEVCRLDTLTATSWRELPAALGKRLLQASRFAVGQIATLPGRFRKAASSENEPASESENGEGVPPVAPEPTSSEQLDDAVAEVKATDIRQLLQDDAAAEIPTVSPVRELREDGGAALKDQTTETWLMDEKSIESAITKLKKETPKSPAGAPESGESPPDPSQIEPQVVVKKEVTEPSP